MPAIDEETLERRARRAAESILDNEALTADMDDATARAVLAWGTARARADAQETSDLDDEAADELLAARMRATRRTLRAVNALVARRAELDPATLAARLAEIGPPELVTGLRALLADAPGAAPNTIITAPTAAGGEHDPQEEIIGDED